MKRVYTLNESEFRRLIRREVLAMSRGSRSRFFDRLFEADGEALKDLDVSKGPSEIIKFLNGPGADKRVRALLAAGTEDGAPDDEAAQVGQTSKTIGDLQPTQIEIELTKSIGFPLAKFDSLKKMISGGVQRVGPEGNDMIVTSGDLIIDGHHRWSSLFSVAGPAGQIAAIDVVLPEKDAASVLAIVQAAIASTLKGGQKVPAAKAGGMNILGKSKDEIAKLIEAAYESGEGEAGPILTDEYISKCMVDPQVNKHFGIQEANIAGPVRNESHLRGSLLEKKGKFGGKYGDRNNILSARSLIIDKVSENLSQMNPPADGAPPRLDMPQLDKAEGGVQGALDNLATGKVNYKAPFGESVERWQRLAGILKG